MGCLKQGDGARHVAVPELAHPPKASHVLVVVKAALPSRTPPLAALRKKMGADEGSALDLELQMLMNSEVLQTKKVRALHKTGVSVTRLQATPPGHGQTRPQAQPLCRIPTSYSSFRMETHLHNVMLAWSSDKEIMLAYPLCAAAGQWVGLPELMPAPLSCACACACRVHACTRADAVGGLPLPARYWLDHEGSQGEGGGLELQGL
jgi:hypothetical protein